jgi:hypothetical protein
MIKEADKLAFIVVNYQQYCFPRGGARNGMASTTPGLTQFLTREECKNNTTF